MFFRISIEVLPQHRRQDIFRLDHRVQQLRQRHSLRRETFADITQGKIGFQIQIATKTHQHDAFTVLRQKMFAVDDFRIVWPIIFCISHVIAQFVQRLHDDAERFTLVVTFQVFDVFEHKHRRTTRVDNAYHIKKQRALGIAGKTVRPPERVLFRYASQRKWLTRETGQ
nr:unnamed protein product [Escherichia coli K-12]